MVKQYIKVHRLNCPDKVRSTETLLSGIYSPLQDMLWVVVLKKEN